MKRLAAAFLLLLPLLSSPIHAQDAAPWPPDPKAIFAPGVEVVSVEVKAPREYNLPTYDNKTRIVRVYSEAKQRWQTFPYPDEVKNFNGRIDPSSSHTLLLSTSMGGDFGVFPLPKGQWLLDSDTGQFSRPELACGELRANLGQGDWIIQARDDNKNFFLCNTESGKEVGPLPLQKPDYLQSTSTSPDGKHVVIFGNSDQIYSYAFDTNTLIVLGSSQGTYIQWAGWIDNQRVFIYTTDEADMSFPWRNYSLADVTKPDSRKWIAQTIKPREITTLDNPHRTQWITYTDDNKCLFTELNWETAKITDYDLDGLCSEGTVIPDGSGDRLYFEFNWPDDAFDMGMAVKQPLSSKLVRYNPFTGKRTDLLNGEIEWVEDISPDGLNAVVVTDDDGCFEAYPREDPWDNPPYCESKRASKPRHVVVDLKTGDILYEQPTEWVFNGDGTHWYVCYNNDTKSIQESCAATLTAGPKDSWMLIDDRLVLQAAYHDSKPEYTVIDLRGGKPQKQVIVQADDLHYLAASRQLLIKLADSSPSTTASASEWLLFDVASGKRTPVIQKIMSDQYWVLFGADTPDSLTVTVLPAEGLVNGQLDSVERYVYTVRFPKP